MSCRHAHVRRAATVAFPGSYVAHRCHREKRSVQFAIQKTRLIYARSNPRAISWLKMSRTRCVSMRTPNEHCEPHKIRTSQIRIQRKIDTKSDATQKSDIQNHSRTKCLSTAQTRASWGWKGEHVREGWRLGGISRKVERGESGRGLPRA